MSEITLKGILEELGNIMKDMEITENNNMGIQQFVSDKIKEVLKEIQGTTDDCKVCHYNPQVCQICKDYSDKISLMLNQVVLK